MKRISTLNRQVGLFGPGKDGFRDGSVAQSIDPTEFDAAWCNTVQEELAAIVESVMSLDPNNEHQVLAALKAMFLGKDGGEMTGAITQKFSGLYWIGTPVGGAFVRKYADVTNAAAVGGIEDCTVYNCAVDIATGAWVGRDVADICWMAKWSDVGGLYEFWYAPAAAAGVVPAWTRFSQNDLVNSVKTIYGSLVVTGNISSNSMGVTGNISSDSIATLTNHLITLGQADSRYLNAVPPGTLIDYAGTTPPPGFLARPAAATNISVTAYPALAAAIGITHGNGPTTSAGAFVVGTKYVIVALGTTDFTLIGAASNTVGAVFTATGVGAGTGTAATTFGLPPAPPDYADVAAAGNVGTQTVGEVIAHAHALAIAANGSTTITPNNGFTIVSPNMSTASTGGPANKAAGVRVLKCIKY